MVCSVFDEAYWGTYWGHSCFPTALLRSSVEVSVIDGCHVWCTILRRWEVGRLLMFVFGWWGIRPLEFSIWEFGYCIIVCKRIRLCYWSLLSWLSIPVSVYFIFFSILFDQTPYLAACSNRKAAIFCCFFFEGRWQLIFDAILFFFQVCIIYTYPKYFDAWGISPSWIYFIILSFYSLRWDFFTVVKSSQSQGSIS